MWQSFSLQIDNSTSDNRCSTKAKKPDIKIILQKYHYFAMRRPYSDDQICNQLPYFNS